MRKLELLGKQHAREDFDCGSEPLNSYLQHTARQHAKRGISRTFVLVDESDLKRVLGFFSINLCQLKSENLSPAEAKRLPRNVPAIKLGRLAVDKQFQRQGIGKALLVGAMRKVVEVHETAGGIGMFVDAKDKDAKYYYERFGFVSLPSNELELFLPMATLQEALAELND